MQSFNHIIITFQLVTKLKNNNLGRGHLPFGVLLFFSGLRPTLLIPGNLTGFYRDRGWQPAPADADILLSATQPPSRRTGGSLDGWCAV